MDYATLKERIIALLRVDPYNEKLLKESGRELLQFFYDEMAMITVEDLFPVYIELCYERGTFKKNLSNEHINTAIECCNLLKDDVGNDEQTFVFNKVVKIIMKYQKMKDKIEVAFKSLERLLEDYLMLSV